MQVIFKNDKNCQIFISRFLKIEPTDTEILIVLEMSDIVFDVCEI